MYFVMCIMYFVMCIMYFVISAMYFVIGVLCNYFPMWETHLFANLNFELHFQKMGNHAMA